MKDLVNKSVYILREAKSHFRKPAVMWSVYKEEREGRSHDKEDALRTLRCLGYM